MTATLPNTLPRSHHNLTDIREKMEELAGGEKLESFIARRLTLGTADFHLNTGILLRLRLANTALTKLDARTGGSNIGDYVRTRLTEPTPAQVAA